MGAIEAESSWSLRSSTSTLPYANFGSLEIALQPLTSDAYSTSTTASEMALSNSLESSATPHTTPDIDSDEVQVFGGTKANNEFMDPNDGNGEVNTRRRSVRLSSRKVPVVPSRRKTRSVKSTNTATCHTSQGASFSDGESQIIPMSTCRRKSARLSTTQLMTTAIQPTPATSKNKLNKRSYEIMVSESQSAAPKTDSFREAKTKIEDPNTPETLVAAPIPKRKRDKVWIDHGLYVGVEQESKLTLVTTAKGKTRGKAMAAWNKAPLLPLPISNVFEMQKDFKMPYFVWAPTPYHIGHVPGWRILNHNVFIGDASTYWKKENASNVKCVCTVECNDHCLNRCTWMECDNESCNVGRSCKNRAFADLRDRIKRKKGKDFARGVDVFLTEDRGYGLRATRSFEPHQIIVEYTGEIVTQEESERRMDEVYKDNQNYYLMLFDQNMILDATRGSVARFVNHSCEPNSRMEKWLVEGKPRMALFAGDKGVNSGDELTYDYNFNWFKGVTQQSCKCGSEKCRGTLGKRTDVPKPKAVLASKKAKNAKASSTISSSSRKGKAATKITKTHNIASTNLSSVLAQRPRSRLVSHIVPTAIAKPKRKAPTRRRPSTPPQDMSSQDCSSPLSVLSSSTDQPEVLLFPAIKRESPEFPEISPLLSSSDEEDEPFHCEPAPKRPTPPPLVQRNRSRRVLRTYKVNKTILPPIAKMVTNEANLNAVRDLALEQVLAEAAEAEAAKEKVSICVNNQSISVQCMTSVQNSAHIEDGAESDSRGTAIAALFNGVGGVAAALGKSIYASA